VDFLNFLQSLVGQTHGVVPYLIVFGVLLACGLGVPLPEDVSLIFGGFLVYEERAQLPLMMLTGYLGIIIGDSMIFFFGRRLGSKLGTKQGGFFNRIISPDKRARVEGLFKKHGEKIVLLARFLPGVRSVTYFTAGSVGMKYSHFVFFDSVAALASAPIFVFLGFKFGGELEELLHKIARGQRNVVVVLVVVIVAGVLFSRWRSKREAKANAEALRQKELEQPEPSIKA
jgi:membrane protein DedA with SNARE-associated domain